MYVFEFFTGFLCVSFVSLQDVPCSWQGSMVLTRHVVHLAQETSRQSNMVVTCHVVYLAQEEGETTCVTDPLGYPILHMENHSEEPMYFHIGCLGQHHLLYVKQGTAMALPVYFNWQPEANDQDNCVLFQRSEQTHVAVIYIGVSDESGIQFNITSCSISPGLENRLQAYTSCDKDWDGFVTIHFVNNFDEAQILYFHCASVVPEFEDLIEEEYQFMLNPGDRLWLSIEYFRGFDYEYRTCVFMPSEDGCNVVVYNTLDMYGEALSYGALWCQGRTAFDEPVIELIPHCPPTTRGDPELELRADVPAYAIARCRNGDHAFVAESDVLYILQGTFDQGITSSCQFFNPCSTQGNMVITCHCKQGILKHQTINSADPLSSPKKESSNTYTVDVEIGWGQERREVFSGKNFKTVVCGYDDYGDSESSVEEIGESFWNPSELATWSGEDLGSSFEIRILDAYDREINTAHLRNGKKIRLKVSDSTGTISAFRAHSCMATNGVTSYTILRSGCGDGLIFDKEDGFRTEGNTVYSPFFRAFRLRGGFNLWFQCRFTTCGYDGCNGSSCESVGW